MTAQKGDSDRPPVTDRTLASDEEFLAEMGRLDRLEVADESAVERVARAIGDASDAYDPRDWCDYQRDAAVAIAALKPPPPDGGGQAS